MKENNNGTDINVGSIEDSIEEDITKINTYIELVLEKNYCNCNELNAILGKHCDGSKNIAYAMQHILSAYRRVLKENEELLELRVSASAHNRIVELEKENEEWNRKFCNLQNLYFKLQDESESKRKEYQETYKDVREELKELKNDYENLSNSVVVKNHYIKNSIPIQKVKDLIEELKENGYWNYLEERDLETTIEILKKIIRK